MFPVITVDGNAFERGYRYGVQARKRIAGSIRVYTALFAAYGIGWEQARETARAYKSLVAGLGEVFEEIDGIAEGSGHKLDEILALNIRTEILASAFVQTTQPVQAQPSECTSFALSGTRSADGASRVGQTWDWIAAQRENVLILRVRDRPMGPDFITITEAGMVAKIGVNEAGLAVGLNILRATNDGEEVGVPVHVFQRLALDFDSVKKVHETAHHVSFAASSVAMLADANGNIGALEYSPTGVALVAEDQGVIAHTNHFCDVRLSEQQARLQDSLSTYSRFERAQKHVMGWPDRVTTRNLTTLLRDEVGESDSGKLSAICRSPDPSLEPIHQIESVLGVIINCKTREMLVAPGIPSQVEFRAVPWE